MPAADRRSALTVIMKRMVVPPCASGSAPGRRRLGRDRESDARAGPRNSTRLSRDTTRGRRAGGAGRAVNRKGACGLNRRGPSRLKRAVANGSGKAHSRGQDRSSPGVEPLPGAWVRAADPLVKSTGQFDSEAAIRKGPCVSVEHLPVRRPKEYQVMAIIQFVHNAARKRWMS
jgi:hypothetical protein